MTKKIVYVSPKNTIRITLPAGEQMILYADGTMELGNAPDVTPHDTNYISMTGAISIPEWLYLAMRFAAIQYADQHQMKPIPEYGDHMTVEAFKELCDCGMFTEYDGSGYYATETEMSGIQALPSRLRQGIIEKEFTHVCWFNK